MSAGRPVPLAVAEPIALELVALLRDSCERLEVAGSIRRRKPMVADIELVAVPRIEGQPTGDLWGSKVNVDLLQMALDFFTLNGRLQPRDVTIRRASGTVEHQVRLGDSYKALVYRDLPVDLFIVRPPADWGVILALRTGPGDWNTRIVTDCHRYLRRVAGGRVYRAGEYVPCPEERDFFEAVGQPWIEPEYRAVNRVRLQARPEVPA